MQWRNVREVAVVQDNNKKKVSSYKCIERVDFSYNENEKVGLPLSFSANLNLRGK